MVFSKSFGYAVRSVLYVALMQDEKRNVQAEEVALNLGVPRHFIGKILKRLVKRGVLQSVKGPLGGFRATPKTATVSLLELFQSINGPDSFWTCALRLGECNNTNPCPLHQKMECVKQDLWNVLSQTTVQTLMNEDKTAFIKSISAEDIL